MENKEMLTLDQPIIGGDKPNIYQRLSAISTEASAIAKNLEVGFGQNRYKAVGEADVLATVKPLEAKHGVYSFPYRREIVESGTLESIDKNGNIVKRIFLRIETIYRFINLDDPTDFVDITSYGDGIDSGDKSVGKAMSYSDKYAMLKCYRLITGEDPDQYASEPLADKTTQQTIKRGIAETPNVPETKIRATLNALESRGIPEAWICSKYKVGTVREMSEAILDQIGRNADRLRDMYRKEHGDVA